MGKRKGQAAADRARRPGGLQRGNELVAHAVVVKQALLVAELVGLGSAGNELRGTD